jgi:hypothetical protein
VVRELAEALAGDARISHSRAVRHLMWLIKYDLAEAGPKSRPVPPIRHLS